LTPLPSDTEWIRAITLGQAGWCTYDQCGIDRRIVVRAHLAPVRRWGLWTAPRRVVALVLTVGAVACLAVVASVALESVTATDLARFGGLALLGCGYVATCRRIEASHRLVATGMGAVYADVMSVWALAAAVLLPVYLAASLVAFLYLQSLLSTSALPDGRPRPYRHAYNAAAMVLACAVVGVTVAPISQLAGTHGMAGALLALVVAVPVFAVVDTLVVAAAMYLNSGTKRPAALFGSWSENALEVATLLLGAVTALSIIYAPWAAVLVLPAVFLLQHQALLRQLVAAATTDVKTELLNATAWRQIARREVARASQRGGSAAILVLDMDHFKRINDQHGHLAGDATLKAVGAALADELRGYDAVGRFGGEEFVAVLPDTDTTGAEHAAQRLRRRIEALAITAPGNAETLSVTASIGVALCPGHGAALDDVLHAADDAMYEAKRAGRNAVRLAPPAASLRGAAS
jgi:diguanylate cyclase (GGDEF)-like protein